MKNFTFALLLILLTTRSYSQSVDGQFVTNIVGSTYQVTIETNMQSGTGSAGIVAIDFTFNTLGLSFPASPVSGVDYIVQGDFASYPTKNILRIDSDKVSINLATFGTPAPLTTTPMAVILINFTIINAAQSSILSWTKTEITPAFGQQPYTVGNWPNLIDDPLPVELVSFAADVKEDNKVHLSWQTATEVNNYGFEIERSINENEWIKLGFVEGNGNSNSPKSYLFTDNSPVGGSKFQYRLKQLDTDGKFEYSNEIKVEIVPTVFALYQNYPNPFNPTTKIRYQLPKESKVVIKIYDILGAEVISLLNEKKEPGVYEVELNAQSLPSGIYIYRIITEDFVETKKMVLMR